MNRPAHYENDVLFFFDGRPLELSLYEALFRRLDAGEILCRPNPDAMERAICDGSLPGIAAQVRNVFEPAVSCDHPEIGHIKGICMDCGALTAQMTGSGSVVFALMPDGASAQLAMDRLREFYPQTFLAEPV